MVVLYRRPVEARASDPDDLVDIVHDLIVDRVAHLIGRDPESLDPHA
jgi:predicted Zn-dependent protease with MMP-like domain